MPAWSSDNQCRKQPSYHQAPLKRGSHPESQQGPLTHRNAPGQRSAAAHDRRVLQFPLATMAAWISWPTPAAWLMTRLGCARLAADGYLFFGSAERDWASAAYHPGDVLLFHRLTPHAALPNTGTALRLSGDFRWQRPDRPAPAELILGPAATRESPSRSARPPGDVQHAAGAPGLVGAGAGRFNPMPTRPAGRAPARACSVVHGSSGLAAVAPAARRGALTPPPSRCAAPPRVDTMRNQVLVPRSRGARASPRDLTSFGAQAEEAGVCVAVDVPAAVHPGWRQDGPGVDNGVLDPMVALGFLAAGDVPDPARRRADQHAVHLPRPAGQAGDHGRRAVRRPARPLGLGIGWLPEEFRLTGASMARRGARAEEYVRVLHELWNPGADGMSQYDGEFYAVPPGRRGIRGRFSAPVRRQPRRHVPPRDGTGRPDRRRLDDGQPGRPDPDGRQHQDRPDRGRRRRAGPGQAPDRVPGVACCRQAHSPETGERLLLSGSYAEIRADTDWLGEQGVTGGFYDLNRDPLIGSPKVDHAAATGRAREIMAALAPSSRSGLP